MTRTHKLTVDGAIVIKDGELIVKDPVAVLQRINEGSCKEWGLSREKGVSLFVDMAEHFGRLTPAQTASLRRQLAGWDAVDLEEVVEIDLEALGLGGAVPVWHCAYCNREIPAEIASKKYCSAACHVAAYSRGEIGAVR